MNQGSRTGKGTAFMASRRPEELCPGGDRASVVAKKRGNARGVKGGRKVETLNESTKENSTVNVQWTQFGEEQKQVREPSTLVQSLFGRPGNGRQRLNEPESSGDAPANLSKANHQLESRIQEIWQSGSEGGAKPTFVPTPIATPKSRPVGYGVIRAGVRTDSMIGVTKFRMRKLKTFMLYDFWPTRLAIAKAVQLIKAGSSAWIHQTFPNLRNFAWQQGYGAFSVGISQVQETLHYIEQQLEHHRTRTFQEEYLAFLKKLGAHFAGTPFCHIANYSA